MVPIAPADPGAANVIAVDKAVEEYTVNSVCSNFSGRAVGALVRNSKGVRNPVRRSCTDLQSLAERNECTMG